MHTESQENSQATSRRLSQVLDEAIAKLEAANRTNIEPIALIGMACRFPGGANDPSLFWNLLKAGGDAIGRVPPDRWDADAYYGPGAEGKIFTKEGGFLDQVDQFDAHYFGISRREATSMDPQHRLLMEVAVEALENAGHMPNRAAGRKVGVFVGITNSDYLRLLSGLNNPALIDGYYATGNLLSAAAGRLSYSLGLVGPSLAVDTACSSSLVAVHLACHGLRAGECELALAGGVNLILSPEASIALSRGQMLSPDGRCKAFDAAANGYGRGEGCGMVVLKCLSAALKDNDQILAVIRASAINQDGPSAGFTVPSGISQEAVIRSALKLVNFTPADIAYVEAHGTGTSLGDPIEVDALARALGQGRPSSDPLLLGTVKTNIGHLESAAGIAALIKVVLALQNGELPPLANFKKPNPHVDWDKLPIRLVTKRVPWGRGDQVRRAGVSAFGISGTNAHLIVEEPPPLDLKAAEDTQIWHVLPLSARSKKALQQLANRFEAQLTMRPELSLGDVCFTASTGRMHHQYRLAVAASSLSQTTALLRSFRDGVAVPGVCVGEYINQPAVALLFSGGHFPYSGAARALHATQSLFREPFDLCAKIVQGRLGIAASELLDSLQGSGGHDVNDYSIHAAIFSFEYALARLWNSWGINPIAVVGLGPGECAAACIAGILTLEDALELRLASAKANRGDRDLKWPAGQISSLAPTIKYLSGLTGGSVSTGSAFRNYCPGQLNEPIKLFETVENVRHLGVDIILAVSPHTGFSSALEANSGSQMPLLLSSVRDRICGAQSVFEVLGALYTKGVPISWESIYQDTKRRRVPLPTNPWQRQGYWFDQSPANADVSSRRSFGPPLHDLLEDQVEEIAAALQGDPQFTESERTLLPKVLHRVVAEGRRRLSTATVDDWLYKMTWQHDPEPNVEAEAYSAEALGVAPGSSLSDSAPTFKEQILVAGKDHLPLPPSKPASDHWIVFAENSGIAEQLAALLERRGDSCSLVRRGTSFDPSDPKNLSVAPDRLADFEQLFAAFRHQQLKGVLYLWNLDDGSRQVPASSDMVASMVENTCQTFLYVVQSLLAAGYAKPPSLTLVTRGAMAVTNSAPDPGYIQSCLWGINKTLALEHPEYHPIVIDLDPVAQPHEPEAMATEIFAHKREPEVALRGNKRFLARLARHSLVNRPTPTAFDPDATYLITGGLGGLGLSVAEWMVSLGAKHLVLVSRNQPNALAADKLRRLEEASAQVMVAQADVSERAQIADVLEQITSSGIPLRGVIHSAGILDDGILSRLSWERFQRVLKPKVAGAWHLHALTQSIPLDFFVLFSSGASLFGAPGQGNYVAANAFLDAFAHFRRSHGLPALSINWGPWAEVGAATKRNVVGRAIAHGIGLIPPKKGLEALGLLFTQSEAQVGVVPIDWEQFSHAAAERPFFSALVGTTSSASKRQNKFLAEFYSTSRKRQRALLSEHVRSHIMKVLGLDTSAQADVEQNLLSEGMDSLTSMELRNNLQASLGIPLPSTLVYDHPTTGSITDFLLSKLASETAASDRSEVTRKPVTNAPDLDSLSEHELSALLDEELQGFGSLE